MILPYNQIQFYTSNNLFRLGVILRNDLFGNKNEKLSELTKTGRRIADSSSI